VTLDALRILTSDNSRWQVAERVEHGFGAAEREVPFDPARQPRAHIHGRILPRAVRDWRGWPVRMIAR